MKSIKNAFALGIITIFVLPGCTPTLLLKPVPDDSASATVESPPLYFGTARLTVVLDGKRYAGAAGELREDKSGMQARRFGWRPGHKHPNIRQEIKFLFGSSVLTAADGTQLECDHLRHGDDWRLRCKRPGGGEVQLQRDRQ